MRFFTMFLFVIRLNVFFSYTLEIFFCVAVIRYRSLYRTILNYVQLLKFSCSTPKMKRKSPYKVHVNSITPKPHILTLCHWYLLNYSVELSLSWKLTFSQLVKKFPAFYGTRKFITVCTNTRTLSSGTSFGKWDNYFLISLKSSGDLTCTGNKYFDCTSRKT